MPLATATVKATFEPKATANSDKLSPMPHRASPVPTISPLYRRLEHVLRLLDKSWQDLYRDTALGQDYISKLKSGRLGKERPQKLAMEMFQAYGVPFDVWSSDRLDWRPPHHPTGVIGGPPTVTDPSTGPRLTSTEGGMPQMGVMTGPQTFPGSAMDLRRELARIATELDEPKEVVLELLSVEPPLGADRDWWFRQYVEIVRRHRERPARK